MRRMWKKIKNCSLTYPSAKADGKEDRSDDDWKISFAVRL